MCVQKALLSDRALLLPTQTLWIYDIKVPGTILSRKLSSQMRNRLIGRTIIKKPITFVDWGPIYAMKNQVLYTYTDRPCGGICLDIYVASLCAGGNRDAEPGDPLLSPSQTQTGWCFSVQVVLSWVYLETPSLQLQVAFTPLTCFLVPLLLFCKHW